MHKKFFNAMYVLNIAMQAIFSLLSPIALGALVSWILVSRAGVGEWIYVVLILLGVGSGLVGMVRFVLSAMSGVERLEKEQAADEGRRRKEKREGNVGNEKGK